MLKSAAIDALVIERCDYQKLCDADQWEYLRCGARQRIRNLWRFRNKPGPYGLHPDPRFTRRLLRQEVKFLRDYAQR